MLVIDMIKGYAPDHEVVFDYCFYDRTMTPRADESLSFCGRAADFEAVMAVKNPAALHLYATCGECYDFEVVEDSPKRTHLRYIDFR